MAPRYHMPARYAQLLPVFTFSLTWSLALGAWSFGPVAPTFTDMRDLFVISRELHVVVLGAGALAFSFEVYKSDDLVLTCMFPCCLF